MWDKGLLVILTGLAHLSIQECAISQVDLIIFSGLMM